MIYIVLISITSLFFAFAFVIRPQVKKHLGRNVCSICAACSTTWVALLALRTFNILEVDNTLLGVLMGGSVVGIMFELQDYFKKKRIQRFWIIRLLEIVIGFYLAYSVATMNQQMVIIGSIGCFFVILVSFVLIRTSKDSRVRRKVKNRAISKDNKISENEKADAIKRLEESLEDCC